MGMENPLHTSLVTVFHRLSYQIVAQYCITKFLGQKVLTVFKRGYQVPTIFDFSRGSHHNEEHIIIKERPSLLTIDNHFRVKWS
jgi:hypothetical protein